MLRLIAVIDHQRRELDRIRASVAQDSVVAMARGALMERLGLSSAEAAAQLAELSAATAIPLAEMAAAVLVWLLEADGTLALLGEQGLPHSEARRWRHIPPQLDCPAQRVAHGAANLWWDKGRRDSGLAPVAAVSDGARAVLALRERSGELLGVMEVSWPGSMAFTAEVRQHLSSLAAGCARVVAARLAHGDLAAAHPKEAVYTLLDDLAESVLVARAIRDAHGEPADFSIEHVSPAFRDPAGRADIDLARLTLLEAYPASVAGSGLFARA